VNVVVLVGVGGVDDVRVLQSTHGLHLSFEAGYRIGVIQARLAQYFDRDDSIELGVQRFVDRAHAAGTQLFEQTVWTELFVIGGRIAWGFRVILPARTIATPPGILPVGPSGRKRRGVVRTGRPTQKALDAGHRRSAFLLFFETVTPDGVAETRNELVVWRAKLFDRLLATGTPIDVGRHRFVLIRRQNAQHTACERLGVRTSRDLLSCVAHLSGHSHFAVYIVTRSVSEGRTHCLAYASGYHVFWHRFSTSRSCTTTHSREFVQFSSKTIQDARLHFVHRPHAHPFGSGHLSGSLAFERNAPEYVPIGWLVIVLNDPHRSLPYPFDLVLRLQFLLERPIFCQASYMNGSSGAP